MSDSLEISEKRLLWLTALVLIIMTAVSLSFGNWRVTTGIVLGGLLSLLNVYWLKLSLGALLGQATEGFQPQFKISLYILRYVTIALVVMIALTLKLVTVAATIIGLLSFAFAILLEAFIQIYIVIVNREDY